MEIRVAVIHIKFVDRSGLGYDVFRVFEIHRIEKIAMEVSVASDMMIKFKYKHLNQFEDLLADLRQIPGVLAVTPASEMPYEVRENQLRVILNTVSDGILAVDQGGNVIQSNDAACALLGCEVNQIRGQSISDLLGEQSALEQTLHAGKRIEAFTGILPSNQGNRRYLGSSVPVTNMEGQVLGAVMTLKGEQQIQEILSAVRNGKKPVTFSDIVHQSKQMRRVIETASYVAHSTSTVLLRGESGTGKELFARAVHAESPRREGPFVAVNCGALPEALLESELFGYEPGAFTGATKTGKKGLFEQAHLGTLFLDEVGELPLTMQVKLLRVLQEGTIRRLGGENEIGVNVRMLAATHRDLEELVKRGEFREDLYYRLNVVPLWIPPLREHKEDIPILAQVLLGRMEQKVGRSGCSLTSEGIQWLMHQPWPGNVRQLENTLEGLLNMLPDGAAITADQLRSWSEVSGVGTGGFGWRESERNIAQNTGAQEDDGFNWLGMFHSDKGERYPTLKEVTQAAEKALLHRVLREYPSTRKAGQVLGVSNTTVLNKMRTYHLNCGEARSNRS